MDIELHLQVWNELSAHFTGNEKTEAAEDFIRVLVEHGADATEIAEYAIDTEIKNALLEYIDLAEDEEYDDDMDDYNE